MLMNLGIGDNGVRILEEDTVKNLLAVSSRPEGMEGYSLGLTAPQVDSEDAWFGHGGAWNTNCFVNWHKKQLRLWAIQITDSRKPWEQDLQKAQNLFFETELDNSAAAAAYTGRTE